MTNFEKECREHKTKVINAYENYMDEIQDCYTCRLKTFCKNNPKLMCVDVWKKWLKRDVTENTSNEEVIDSV